MDAVSGHVGISPQESILIICTLFRHISRPLLNHKVYHYYFSEALDIVKAKDNTAKLDFLPVPIGSILI